MSEERFVAIEAKLDAHTKTLDAHTKTLDAHTKTLDTHTKTLDEHTKTLAKLEIGQEEMRDQIAQVAEGHAATQALITRSFAAMHALIDSKVDPYVKAVQHHSAVLAAHKMSLPWEDRNE